MHGINVLNEIERVSETKLKHGEGFINVDLSLYFPFLNQDAVSAEVRFLTEEPSDEFLSAYVVPFPWEMEGSVVNHRYPNNRYLTLSKQVGKNVCKCGEFVTGDIAELNKYQYLLVGIRVGGVSNVYVFPVTIRLTIDKPCSSVIIRTTYGVNTRESFEEARQPHVSIQTHRRVKDEWCRLTYYTHQKDFLIHSPVGEGDKFRLTVEVKNTTEPMVARKADEEIKEVYLCKEPIVFPESKFTEVYGDYY